MSTRAIFRFLEGIYGAFHSPQSIPRLTQVVEGGIRAWRKRPLKEKYYAVFLDGTFLSIPKGKSAREPVYIAFGIKPAGRWGVRRVRIFITDDLPGIEEAIRKIFPEAE